ncbi:MAG TPA: hypothetical protein VGJ91_12350 [Polyangiaceae bacterium]|jgi:hypothetical protein
MHVWRALALLLSASALTLALCAKSADSRAALLRAGAPVNSSEPLLDPELTPRAQVNALRESADGAALEALIGIAQQREPKLVSAALEGIAQIGGDRARQFLARRFKDAADAQLPELASALASLGDTPARAILLSAARSARPAARSAAFGALATLDTADVREFMLQALTSVEPTAAANYFLDCREPRALPALERLARSSADAEPRRAAIDALFAQGASAEAALARLLRADDELCEALLEGQPATVRARRALRQASIERLRAGARTYGRVFELLQHDLSDEAREALVQAARDPASSASALNALVARGDSASLRALSALANDSDQDLSQRAACALVSQPDSRSRPFLVRANRANLKSEADAALLHINAPEARPI